MGNITYKLFIFPVKLDLLLCVRLQTQTHLLKILTELTDLIVRLLPDLKIQISFFDVSGGLLQLCKRNRDRPVDPVDQKRRGNNDKHYIQLHHFSAFTSADHMHPYRYKNHRQDHYNKKNNDKFCFEFHPGLLSDKKYRALFAKVPGTFDDHFQNILQIFL